jgi:hypothetical protein
MLWMTGGMLVPVGERERYNKLGLDLLMPDASLEQLLKDMNIDKQQKKNANKKPTK